MHTLQHRAERRKAIFPGSCPLAATGLQALGGAGHPDVRFLTCQFRAPGPGVHIFVRSSERCVGG